MFNIFGLDSDLWNKRKFKRVAAANIRVFIKRRFQNKSAYPAVHRDCYLNGSADTGGGYTDFNTKHYNVM